MGLPKLALTMGDPAGVGPELAVKAAADPGLAAVAEIVLYGCPDVIAAAAAKFAPGSTPRVEAVGTLPFPEIAIGENRGAQGLAARDAVVQATRDALAGKVDAIVTAPMSKAAVNMADVPFTGHTELIAGLCGVDNYAMRQSDGQLRVVFVTTHIPLAQVCAALSAGKIMEVTRLLRDSILAEGVERPRLAMAAVNPHAGENGYMGREEIDIIAPALRLLAAEGFEVDGPFPPDTLFIASTLARYDGVISMYHDQGHIPFKMLAFDRGVNTTLGLPVIRTSVDHGTAFDIAWQGKANPGSLYAAVRLAARFATAKRR